MDVAVWKRIDALNFDAIKRKLMDERSGQGWPQARANHAEQEYKRFLYLMKQFPNEILAPTMDVDRFWHQHILDTTRYARDCDDLFGYFLHHYPYLGLDAGGEQLQQQAGQRMRDLYRQTFGEDGAAATTAFCAAAEPGAIAATVFCAASADAAFCAATSQPAFCAATATPAFCAAGSATDLARERELQAALPLAA